MYGSNELPLIIDQTLLPQERLKTLPSLESNKELIGQGLSVYNPPNDTRKTKEKDNFQWLYA